MIHTLDIKAADYIPDLGDGFEEGSEGSENAQGLHRFGRTNPHAFCREQKYFPPSARNDTGGRIAGSAYRTVQTKVRQTGRDYDRSTGTYDRNGRPYPSV